MTEMRYYLWYNGKKIAQPLQNNQTSLRIIFLREGRWRATRKITRSGSWKLVLDISVTNCAFYFLTE